MTEEKVNRLKVKVAKTLFYNEMWGIISVEPVSISTPDFNPELNKWKNFIVRGNLPFRPEEKQELEIEITDIKSDPKYGNYYEIVRVHMEELNTVESQQRYLSAILSEHRAKLIIDAFPNSMIIDDVRDGKINLLSIKGIGASTEREIKSQIENNKDLGALMIETSDLNLTGRMLSRIIEKYGDSTTALAKVRDSLYNLCSISGISFKRVDEAALARGEDPTSNKRIRSYSHHYFDEIANQGHSWVNERTFLEQSLSDLNINASYIRKYMESEEGERYFYWQQGDKRISSMFMYENEKNVFKHLLRLYGKYEAPEVKDLDFAIQTAEESLGIKYTDEQKKAITEAIMYGVFILNGKGGTGKALSNDSVVKTPNGDVEIGSIEVGTEVFNSYGETSKVVGVYPQGEKEVWEVEFSDGVVVECCEDHLWNYQTCSERDRKKGFKTGTIKEIYEEGIKKTSKKTSRWNIYIPMSEPVQYKSKKLPIPPYLLGSLLGDGGLTTDSIRFTNSEADVVEKVNLELKEIGYKLKEKSRFNYSVVMNKREKYSPLRVELDKMGLMGKGSQDKFIPKEYLQSSVDDRVNLLKGLIDTDGECENSNYYYSTVSKSLTDDIIELAQSLGMTASVKERQTHYTYKGEKHEGKPSYRVSIKTTDNISKIHSSQKHEEKWKKGQSSARRTIRRITKTKNKKIMTCIQVDSKDKLFLTDGYVVTHNTTVVKGIVEVLEYLGLNYMSCALSGKASNVLKSRGIKSATIHRTFGIGMKEKKTSPVGITDVDTEEMGDVPEDGMINVYIIDETSMVNAAIFADVLGKIKSGAKVIFVGDSGQLSAIGHGDILRDLLKTKYFPTFELMQVHRQAQDSGIIEVAKLIREGKQIFNAGFQGKQMFGVNKDMAVFGYQDKDAIIKDFEKVLYGQNKKITRSHDLLDFQVVVAMKERGDLSSRSINILAQSIFNDLDKPFVSHGGYDYREGDKIIIKGNSYDIKYFKDVENYEDFKENGVSSDECDDILSNLPSDDARIEFLDSHPTQLTGDLFNGTVGIVVALEEVFDYEKDKMVKKLVIDLEGFGVKVFEQNELDSIELAYATTCHRLQGSTIKNVIVLLDYSAYSLLSLQWLYTAITRASQRCILMAQSAAVVKAISTDASGNRQTFLGDMIKNVRDTRGNIDKLVG